MMQQGMKELRKEDRGKLLGKKLLSKYTCADLIASVAVEDCRIVCTEIYIGREYVKFDREIILDCFEKKLYSDCPI